MSKKFGTGIALDEEFDLSLDQTGDIATTTGTDELEKDLALNTAIELNEYIGSPPTATTKSDITRDTRITLLEDERVLSVDPETIDVTIENRETIIVDVNVVTKDEDNINLVFTV